MYSAATVTSPRFTIEDIDPAPDSPEYATVGRRLAPGESHGIRTPKRPAVEALKREVEFQAAVEARARELLQQTPQATAALPAPELPAVPAPDLEDLPSLVVDETKKRVRDGTARIAVKDGLTAQTILERRAERAEDKQFMLNLARALAGGGAAGPVPVLGPGTSPDQTADDTVEADYTEVEGDDMSLAPAHLRADT